MEPCGTAPLSAATIANRAAFRFQPASSAFGLSEKKDQPLGDVAIEAHAQHGNRYRRGAEGCIGDGVVLGRARALRALSDSQNRPEAHLTGDHAFVSVRRLLQWKGLNHRPHAGRRSELERVL